MGHEKIFQVFTVYFFKSLFFIFAQAKNISTKWGCEGFNKLRLPRGNCYTDDVQSQLYSLKLRHKANCFPPVDLHCCHIPLPLLLFLLVILPQHNFTFQINGLPWPRLPCHLHTKKKKKSICILLLLPFYLSLPLNPSPSLLWTLKRKYWDNSCHGPRESKRREKRGQTVKESRNLRCSRKRQNRSTRLQTQTHTYKYIHTHKARRNPIHSRRSWLTPNQMQRFQQDTSCTNFAAHCVLELLCVCFCQMRDTEITVRMCYSPNSGDARGVNEGNKEERSRTAKNRQGQLLCGHLSSSLTGLKDVQRQLQGQ